MAEDRERRTNVPTRTSDIHKRISDVEYEENYFVNIVMVPEHE